jgi:hypothetical protein
VLASDSPGHIGSIHETHIGERYNAHTWAFPQFLTQIPANPRNFSIHALAVLAAAQYFMGNEWPRADHWDVTPTLGSLALASSWYLLSELSLVTRATAHCHDWLMGVMLLALLAVAILAHLSSIHPYVLAIDFEICPYRDPDCGSNVESTCWFIIS